jgi:hypothetical protein
MAGRWHDFGQYNAQAVTGANALSAGIEHMVTGLSSSPDSERGVAARLRYLTASAAGYAAIERASIHVTARTELIPTCRGGAVVGGGGGVGTRRSSW